MKQQIIQIKNADLLDRVERLRADGCRLVQICCTRVPEGFELSYTFDKDYHMYHLRLTAAEAEPVMSITGLYWPAFIYENEMRDLFGVQIRHIATEVDYCGKFYRLSEKTPWFKPGPQRKPPVKPAAKPAAAPPAPAAAASAVRPVGASAPAAAASAPKPEQAGHKTEGGANNG